MSPTGVNLLLLLIFNILLNTCDDICLVYVGGNLILNWLLVALLFTMLPVIHSAYASKQVFPDKQVTMNISQGEMVYCYYGNPEVKNVICDSMVLKDSFTMIDRFLEVLEYGPTTQDLK
jgi:hypothetical protein